MTPKEIGLAYIRAFCEGRIEDIVPLLHASFTLEGPLARFTDAASYIENLRSDPPEPGSCDIIQAVEDPAAGTLAVFYDYVTEQRTLRIAQHVVVHSEKIAGTILIFDGHTLR